MKNLFQAIGIVVVLCVLVVVFVGLMYLSYILGIAVLIGGATFGVYYMLTVIKDSNTLDI